MITTVIQFMRYYVVLIFGAMVSFSFAGMTHTRKNYLNVGCFTAILFIIQVFSLRIFGMDTTLKIYPLITHIPIFIFIILFFKCSWLISITSVFASYLCCQLPRWIGAVSGEVFNNTSFDHIGYILTVLILYYFLQKYVVKPVRHIIERSKKSCLLFCAVPLFYYFFDYIAFIYTDIMYSGTRAVVQFMPFILSLYYFIFVLIYYFETQKQISILRERDMLDTQLKQAQIEFASLRQLQQNAATYRHDMRHHFAHLQNLASNGRIEEINEYLRTAQSDIEAITPLRYCENETVNLILSSYVARSKQLDIAYTIDINLPSFIPLSDTELCSLLSNALENAINANEKIIDINKRFIELRMFLNNNKLCIDICNNYQLEPRFQNGLPVSNEQDHGFGTKSIVHIIEKHNGLYNFSIEDEMFVFQATI